MSKVLIRRRAAAVLAFFVATMCVTLLAPLLRPVAYERVCSVSGSKLIATTTDVSAALDDASSGGVHTHAAHCPLCMPAGMPPTLQAWDFTPVQPLAHVRQSIPAARLAGLVGAPLPARGPPLLS